MAAASSSLIPSDGVGLKDLTTEAFVKAYGKHGLTEVKDTLQAATRARMVAVSEGLRKQVEDALRLLQSTLAEAEGGDAPIGAPSGPDVDAAMNLSFEALRLCANLAYEVFAATREQAPAALAETAQLLHTHALLALELCPAVQDAVARLCCAWWAANGPDKEELLSQTLPFLLIRALTDVKGRACSVKPCLEMRHALGLLDFEDDSIDDMKRLLLQAAKSPLFLQRPEGRRFLAHILTLHPSLVTEMASVMRNMVVTGKQWVLEAVGEVILRGWREATGPCAAAIESTLIQGFAKACLHASTKGLASNILVVLHQLHEAKRLGPGGGAAGGGALDGALVRLYEPLLFRALSAANAAVRRNGLLLLLDAFPLLDPDASEKEQDEGLSRQLAAVGDALVDPAPAVRAAAAPGCCALLDLYWEIIPSATAAAFVAKLTDQLAFDAAMPGVRSAVLEGLQLLVDNVHAQPVLKRALPQLAPLLHDPAPAVREALADLLLCVSTSRGLKFWEIVPLELLLEVMGRGGGAVDDGLMARVHHLLVPSYVPNAQEGAARVASLLRNNPTAGQAFCRQLTAPLLEAAPSTKARQRVPVPLERVLEIAAALSAHLASHPPTEEPRSPPRKSRGRRTAANDDATDNGARGAAARGKRKKAPAATEGGDAEGEDEEEEERDVLVLGAQDESPESWAALLGGLSELCCGIGAALKRELCDESDVQGLFAADTLQRLLDACPSLTDRRHVWRIAEHLPCLTAAAQLRVNTLKLVASGELLVAAAVTAGAAGPSTSAAGRGRGGAAAAATAPAPGSDPERREELRAILACLAAAPCGPKLAALLAQALGLPWGPEPSGSAVNNADEEEQDEEEEGDGEDELVCKSCGKAKPEHSLLLCDGCDAAYHTGCLRPRLKGIPDGEWFCPGCDKDIRGSRLSAAGALEGINLLLESDAGRQLLQQGGLLSAALPELQRGSTAATEAALAAFAPGQPAAPRGSKGAAAAAQQQQAPLLACCDAVEAATFCARVAMHLSGLALLTSMVEVVEDGEDEAGAAERRAAAAAARAAAAAGLSQAVADASSALASAADWLSAAKGDAGDDDDGWGDATSDTARPLWGPPKRLAAGAATLLGLLGDALRMGLVTLGPLEAETAAGWGRSALGLLLALQPCAMEGPAEDVLKANTALLRLMLSSPTPQLTADGTDAPTAAPTVGDQLGAWVEDWLRALCRGPLARAAPAVRPHVPALLGALLQVPAAAGAADTTSAPPLWLAPLAEAAAAATRARSDAAAAEEEEGGENINPNARRGRGGGKGNKSAAGEGGEEEGAAAAAVPISTDDLPPVVSYFLQAARLKRAERDLSAHCAAAAVASGRSGAWAPALGALQLGKLLGGGRGGGAAAAAVEGLSDVRTAAAAAKGRAAALLVGQIDALAGAQ